MRSASISYAVLIALTGACNGSEAPNGFSDPTHPHVTTVPVSSSSSTTGAGGSESTSSTSSSEWSGSSSTGQGGPKLDMLVPDVPPSPPIGCAGKIDFLFVISTSGTMEGHQQQLADAFPVFMKKIQAQLGEFDVRVLSANPCGGWAMPKCSECTDADDCTYNSQPPKCGAVLESCDESLGAGINFPAGVGASNRRCDFYGGNRFIVGDDPNFEQSFACLTQAGTIGAYPSTADSMIMAVSPDLNGPMGCNAGFLREDALLVVTLLDDGSKETPQATVDGWIQALRDAKQGNEDAFAVLAFSHDLDAGFGNVCDPLNPVNDVNPLRALANGLDHGHFVSICEPNYAGFFESFVDEIVILCEDLHIPQ